MRAVSRYGMPYCERRNRLFPHPFVGWLTPHGIAGLALVPARCDVCAKERGEERLCHAWTALSSAATGVDHGKT
jgi:hypothetical protein